MYKKQYYLPSLAPSSSPFYLCPLARYGYTSPGTSEKTAPFPTFWYVDVGSQRKRVLRKWEMATSKQSSCRLAPTAAQIPQDCVPLRLDQNGQILKRPNPKQRKKWKKQAGLS